MVSQDQIAAVLKLRADFPFFARTCLKIVTTDARLVPFELNTAQRVLNAHAEDMLRRKGYVRIITLKGRKLGISTWTQARAYHKTSLWPNQRAFVLSHHGATSDSIFDISETFHKHNPVAPVTGASNAKELSFARMNSAYEVTTAGSKEVGRGGTRQFFHGSEVAFWENATGHFKASVNSVALVPGTWVILESTANGVGDEFYRRWQNAVAGVGEFEACFLAWFLEPTSRIPVGPEFKLSDVAPAEGLSPVDGELTESEYAEAFGLDLEQMHWRRNKILDDGLDSFKVEYPATAEEAFQSANKGSFIPAKAVMLARRRRVESLGPLILGVDPAGPDGDRFTVAHRRGACCHKIEYRQIGYVEAVEWMADLIDQHKPAAMFVDAGGLGAPLIAFLRAKNPRYDAIVHSVNFGAKSQAKMANSKRAGPVNRRAEMWLRTKNWLENVDTPPQIPDDDALQADLTGVKAKPNTSNDLLLQSKADLKSKGIRSPDFADALALTFATLQFYENISDEDKPVPLTEPMVAEYNPFTGGGGRGSQSWMS